jgi:hypothetical protein
MPPYWILCHTCVAFFSSHSVTLQHVINNEYISFVQFFAVYISLYFVILLRLLLA